MSFTSTHRPDTMQKKPPLHPACVQWPKLSEKELSELALDIKRQGQLEDITLMPDGSILDGSNRWDGCELAKVTPRTVIYEGNDPFGFSISKNKHRRHLEPSQLAMIMARLHNVAHGTNQFEMKEKEEHFTEVLHNSVPNLAEKSGLSESTIGFAKTVLTNATPEIVAMVENGEVTARVAAEAISGKSKTEQASWTKEDVKKKGREKINAYPSSQKRKALAKQKLTVPRPPSVKFPTAAETGFPVNGTLEEKDAFYRKYGRTPLHAKAVKDMLNNAALVDGYATAILTVSNDSHPSAQAFFNAIDSLLTWVPQPEKGADWGINFALRAKKTLKLMDERLPIVVERLTRLLELARGRN